MLCIHVLVIILLSVTQLHVVIDVQCLHFLIVWMAIYSLVFHYYSWNLLLMLLLCQLKTPTLMVALLSLQLTSGGGHSRLVDMWLLMERETSVEWVGLWEEAILTCSPSGEETSGIVICFNLPLQQIGKIHSHSCQPASHDNTSLVPRPFINNPTRRFFGSMNGLGTRLWQHCTNFSHMIGMAFTGTTSLSGWKIWNDTISFPNHSFPLPEANYDTMIYSLHKLTTHQWISATEHTVLVQGQSQGSISWTLSVLFH